MRPVGGRAGPTGDEGAPRAPGDQQAARGRESVPPALITALDELNRLGEGGDRAG
ncbi:hypothetical protein ACFVYF_09295 [Streptomyces sp. NPDC058274]|uniref:hypothetical protein n=1 Tax=Streptomyces sp. NPDC058274 TaxID=3346416 RepID=UPI0036F10BE4